MLAALSSNFHFPSILRLSKFGLDTYLAFCFFSEHFFYNCFHFYLHVRLRSFQILHGCIDLRIAAHFSVGPHSAVILASCVLAMSVSCSTHLPCPRRGAAHHRETLSLYFLCSVLRISKLLSVKSCAEGLLHLSGSPFYLGSWCLKSSLPPDTFQWFLN